MLQCVCCVVICRPQSAVQAEPTSHKLRGSGPSPTQPEHHKNQAARTQGDLHRSCNAMPCGSMRSAPCTSHCHHIMRCVLA